MKSLLSFRWVLVFVLVAIICFIIGHYILNMLMAVGYGILSMGLCLATYFFITRNVMGAIDDYKHIIEEKNVAYALYLMGIAIIIVVAYFSAYMAFVTLK